MWIAEGSGGSSVLRSGWDRVEPARDFESERSNTALGRSRRLGQLAGELVLAGRDAALLGVPYSGQDQLPPASWPGASITSWIQRSR